MIREVHIENYKSIDKLDLELGRVNVLIGENGSGKSNILEAIALASAAARDKLDNEFLASRGIRVTEPRFMRAAFENEQAAQNIRISVKGGDDIDFACSLESVETPTHVQWVNLRSRLKLPTERARLGLRPFRVQRSLRPRYYGLRARSSRPDFIIYAPENSALRVFQAEGQILPLGVKGEGLFAHLKAMSRAPDETRLGEIMEKLALIDWFERLEIPKDLAPGERSIWIRDRYLAEGALFDQRSANEGFLFLLFYFTLFVSPDTPAFFAIDNIDASLNPKLCSALVEELVDLATTHEKQVILTTHNPAVLDGLDLTDDEQRLLVIDRDKQGRTRARRVPVPKPVEGEPPIRLSEAFLRGYIGGLPKNF